MKYVDLFMHINMNAHVYACIHSYDASVSIV